MSHITEKSGDEESYKSERLMQLHNLEEKGYPMYPHKYEVDTTFESFIKQYENLDAGTREREYVHCMSGRVREKRGNGKNLVFYTVDSGKFTLQFFCDKREFIDKENFKILNSNVYRGDIIWVKGFPGRGLPSKNNKGSQGELSIYPLELQILTPCLKFLPKKHFGLKDPEVRAKKRYLDLMVNESSQNVFIKRHKIFNCLRNFLNSRDFIEVSTPILSSQAGGANAKPFITHHNDLKQDMFMRVAPELYLKQLVIGGLNRVYEIGPQFRNESCDTSHNPEFYSIEFYMAYVDYHDLIQICQDLLSEIVQKVTGDLTIEYLPTNSNEPIKIDFTPPYKCFDILTELSKHNISLPDDLSGQETRDYLDNICKERNIQCSEPRTIARLFDKLIEHYIEPLCKNPSFIINHPLVMSPLAKPHRNNPQLSERFELFVNGTELANAYTELNIPSIQRHTFEQQQLCKNQGDDEAQPIDEGFIEALEYGLPPTGGFGMGLDRLVMFLTNKNTIRDVISFPTLKNV